MSHSASNFLNNLLQSTISLASVTLKSRPTTIKKNKSGKVLILANGPSINTSFENPEILKGISEVDTLCVNYFYKSDYFFKIKPAYYIIAAPEMWLDDIASIHLDNRNNMYKVISEKVDWNMTFFIPMQAKETTFWSVLLKKNTNVKISYYNITAIEGFELVSHFFYNKKLGMPRSHNIVGYALMILIWKGYDEIGLLGVEHSWTKSLMVSDNNEALLTQPHFYDKKVSYVKMNNDAEGENKRKLHQILHKFLLTFKAYFEILNYANQKKVKISNLTKNSFIDAYERKDEKKFLF